MSDPFVIWTMRRTGGTAFTSLLMTLSEHKGLQHEPLNPDRKLGSITRDWTTHKDPARLMRDMDAALAERPLIKHCYELVPREVSLALIKSASARGYRHIVLDRQAEVDRILSLELAKITGAWGAQAAEGIYAEIETGQRQLDPIDIGKACDHMRACATLRRWLADTFDTTQHTPLLVYFEEIYDSFEAGRRTVEELLACLGIDPRAQPKYEAFLKEALTGQAQNSRNIAHAVPNIDALRAALEETHVTDGFRFEEAVRSVPASAPTRTRPPENGLIIDIGAGKGDNAGFYLAKGFSVLAVCHEAENRLAIEARFAEEIAAGHLRAVQADLGKSGAPDPLLETAIEKYGPPRYVKIEGRGSELDIITGLSGQHGLPAFLSVQLNMDWKAILARLMALGYADFQLVRQGANHLDAPPNPAREGRYVPMQFTGGMSGCFGRDLPPERWLDRDAFTEEITIVQARQQEAKALGKKAGWYHIHARLPH